MNISAYMYIFINLAKSTEKKKTINVVEDCSHCDLRRIEKKMALTCFKQWDMKKIKVIANHIFFG